jgi:hypothetical protein
MSMRCHSMLSRPATALSRCGEWLKNYARDQAFEPYAYIALVALNPFAVRTSSIFHLTIHANGHTLNRALPKASLSLLTMLFDGLQQG